MSEKWRNKPKPLPKAAPGRLPYSLSLSLAVTDFSLQDSLCSGEPPQGQKELETGEVMKVLQRPAGASLGCEQTLYEEVGKSVRSEAPQTPPFPDPGSSHFRASTLFHILFHWESEKRGLSPKACVFRQLEPGW